MAFNPEHWKAKLINGTYEYMHKNDVVATFGYIKEMGRFRYVENKGKLRSMIDYDSKPTVKKFKDAILKCGKSYYNFNAIYDAIKSLEMGKVNLLEILLKEQMGEDSITAFCYDNIWFVVAPVVNIDKEKEKRIIEPQ